MINKTNVFVFVAKRFVFVIAKAPSETKIGRLAAFRFSLCMSVSVKAKT